MRAKFKFLMAVIPAVFVRVILSEGMVCYAAADVPAPQISDELPPPLKTDSVEIRVYFEQGQSILLPSFRNNDIQLSPFVAKLRTILSDTTMHLQDIVIYTASSPEGSVSLNRQLSVERGDAIRRFLKHALEIPDSVLILMPIGEDWKRLAEMVELYRVPYWQQIMEIIGQCPGGAGEPSDRDLEERERRIKMIDNGKAWKFLLDNVFPELRGGDNYITGHFSFGEGTGSKDTVFVYKTDTVYMSPPGGSGAGVGAGLVAGGVAGVTDGESGGSGYGIEGGEYGRRKNRERKYYQFAVKTNLLMDLGTALNVELEFPIGKQWSIVAEHWFPWWTFWYGEYSYTLQVLQSSVEGRYWFGDRSGKPVLTGMFAGVYAGAAMFDVEWQSEGIQGESFINAGLSFGYSFNIGKNWRFETSLSAGYFHSDGRNYYHDARLMKRVWKEDKAIDWIGPTKLKCSIVWLFPPYRKKKDKEGDL